MVYRSPILTRILRDSSIKECQQLSAPSTTATVVSLPITLSPLEYCAIFFFVLDVYSKNFSDIMWIILQMKTPVYVYLYSILFFHCTCLYIIQHNYIEVVNGKKTKYVDLNSLLTFRILCSLQCIVRPCNPASSLQCIKSKSCSLLYIQALSTCLLAGQLCLGYFFVFLFVLYPYCWKISTSLSQKDSICFPFLAMMCYIYK